MPISRSWGRRRSRVGDMAIRVPPMTRAAALFVALLFEAGHTLRLERLCSMIWDSPPASAPANLRTHVTRLRRLLATPGIESGSLLTTLRGGGYVLTVDPARVDLHVFRRRAQEGREYLRRGEFVQASDAFGAGLSLWDGSVGDGLPPVGQELSALMHALNEERLSTIEDLAEAQLHSGQASSVASMLGAHCSAHPIRERAWALLVYARYSAGDPAGALSAVASARHSLSTHLGLDLGPVLTALHQNVLRRTLPSADTTFGPFPSTSWTG